MWGDWDAWSAMILVRSLIIGAVLIGIGGGIVCAWDHTPKYRIHVERVTP